MNPQKRAAPPARLGHGRPLPPSLNIASGQRTRASAADPNPPAAPGIRALIKRWSSEANWNTGWLFALAIVAATALAYFPIWHGGFIWDDDLYVTKNPLLSAPDGWWRIWFSLDAPSQYFPLTYTVFRLERMLWGLNPAGYHWFNLLLHASNAILLWRVLERMNFSGARLAAVLFALHPVQVESVAWITELKNVLSLFFCLLAVIAWLRVIEVDRGPDWRYYFAGLGCYALALFSKSTACTLPAALLLICWFRGLRVSFSRVLLVFPFVALGMGMGLLAMWWERFHQGTAGKTFALSVLERLLIASHALWFYAGKLVWPYPLAFSYPRWTLRMTDPDAYLWLLGGVVLAVAIHLGRRRFGRGLPTAILFFALTLSPMLGFIMLYTFRYTFVADHYQYVASIGLLSLVASGLMLASARWAPRIRRGLFFVLAVGLGLLTYRQSSAYSDAETLWRRTLEVNPNSTLACNNLGNILLEKGEVTPAQALFERALVADPELAETHCNLGNTLVRKGQGSAAIGEYRRALEIEPGLPEVHNNLGSLLADLGQAESAKLEYGQALELRPNFAGAHNNLGQLLLAEGLADQAAVQFERALALDADDASAHNGLGAALFEQGRVVLAIPHFERALELRPDLATAHNNLGAALLQESRLEQAIPHFQRALELRPKFAEAENNLGKAILKQGRVDAALGHFQRALDLEPQFKMARANLQKAMELKQQETIP